MSSEILRRAASRIRHDVEFGHAHGDDAFLLAVAGWLDEQGNLRIAYGHPMPDGTPTIIFGPSAHALAVARAYLGEAS